MATSVGAVFLEVVPSLDKFASLLSSGTMSDVKRIGQDAGKEFGSALSAGSSSGLEQLKSQVASAALSTERASVQVAAAHNTAATAADRVQLAESKLADARKKYGDDSTQVLAAEQRLSQAKRDAELQSGKTALAENTLKDAQDKQALSAQALKDKQEASTVTTAGLAKGIGLLAVGAAGAAVALGGIGVKSAADFQEQLTRLATSAGESTNNLRLVGDGILKMAGDTGTSTQQLTSGMYTIESAGYHGADGLKVLQAAAEGARTENANLGTVANAVTDILTDYHLPAIQAADVTSKLVATVASGKTNFEELSAAMSSVAPVAAATGIPLQDMLGSIAEMTAHGVSAQQATQNLANTIRTLANPTQQMTQELAQFGIRSDDLSRNLGKTGVSGALEEVSNAIMQHMGPDGAVMIDSFNKSKIAAEDANKMFQSLPPNLQKLAKEMQDGKISQHDWTQGLKQIDPIQANLLRQWLTATKNADGFSQTLKSGSTAAQTYTQALAKATGNSTAMNVALMLTGENAESTRQNISNIAEATDEAGGHVAGWGEVQANFNQKLAQAREGFHALIIKIGQELLPVATQAMDWAARFSHGLADLGGWVQRNANWIGLVASVVGGLVAPILAVTAAQRVWAGVTKTVEIAQAALNLVMDANPIMLIVTAIAALVAGLVYAYFHFQSFHNLVNEVGRFLGGVFMAIWHGLEAAFHAVGAAVGWVVDHWKIFAGIAAVAFAPLTILIGIIYEVVTHLHQIGEAFTWLWGTIIRPVAEFIGEAVTILAKIILAVLIAPVVIAIRTIIGPVFRWLYENAVKPAFDAIGVAAHWLHDNVFKPVFDAIGTAVRWVYDNVLLPIWAGLKVDWQILSEVLRWLHENVFKPIWDAIGTAVRWVYDNVLRPIWDGLKYDWAVLKEALRILYEDVFKPIWDALGQAIDWVYHNVIRPIWDAFKTDLGLLEDAFRTTVNHIGDIWDFLKKAMGTPIEFVIRTVLNDGLIKGINWVLSAVGTSIPLIPDPNLPTFAVGGVVPGYAPGVDSVHAMLSPGEGIIVPQAVRALGGEGGIAAINHMFGGSGRPALAGGVPGFAGGGFVSDILAGIGGAAASAWHGLQHVVLGGMRSAAQGFFDGVVNPLVGLIPGGPDNMARRMVTGEVNKVETSVLDWLGVKDQAAMASLGGSIPVGDRLAIINAALAADGIPQSLWPMWEAGLNTLITRESGWNAGAVNNWDSNAARGTPSMGLAQVILPTFEAYRNRSLVDNLLDPIANVAASINYINADYGGIQNVAQANANHAPQGYASGGVVPGGPNIEINLHGSGSDMAMAQELERRLMFALR